MNRNAVKAVVVLATVSVSACATVSLPDYPLDHPANADAPATAPEAAPRTLADYERPAAGQERTPAGAPDPAKLDPGQAPQQIKDPIHDHH